MKKIGIPVLVLTAFLFSCQKSNFQSQKSGISSNAVSNGNSATANYFLSCQINGVNRAFNENPKASLSVTGWNFNVLSIKGISADPQGGTMSFAIDNTLSAKPIGEGTYTDHSPLFMLDADYMTGQTAPYHAGVSLLTRTANHFRPENTEDFHILITSFEHGEIRGTFGGQFHQVDNPDSASITITNGSFYVKLD